MAIIRHKQLSKTTQKWKPTRRYYVRFKDHLGRDQKLPAFESKRATEEFERQLTSLVESKSSATTLAPSTIRWIENLAPGHKDKLLKLGLLEGEQVSALKPLPEHLAEYRSSMLDRKVTAKQADQACARVTRILDGCGFVHFADINPGTIEAFLAKRRRTSARFGLQTTNHYIAAFKGFVNWAVEEGKIKISPVLRLKKLNPAGDRRHVRRPLSIEECCRLLGAAQASRERFGMTGPDRALLYQLALETGLRASELRSLTTISFQLNNEPFTVTVEAAYSKHRREDVLPLKPATAEQMRDHLAGRLPSAQAFNVPSSDDTADMIKADLDEAGILYEDEAGRFADFHSLRHTFITNLNKAGISVKDMQLLARHSDPKLTLAVYTHSTVQNQAQAVGKLPDLAPLPEAGAEEATGTDDSPAGEKSLPIYLPKKSAPGQICIDKDRQKKKLEDRRKAKIHKGNTAKLPGESVVRPARLERATFGSVDRRSIQLSYGRPVL